MREALAELLFTEKNVAPALYLLGPPRVYRNGVAVGFDRRKVLALLAYLAVSSQRHSRDEVSELLWSGEDRDRARANLRQTLSLLGGIIGEDRLSADRMSVGLAAPACGLTWRSTAGL